MTAPPSDHGRILDGWRGRLEVIRNEVITAHFHQAVWTAFRDEVQKRRPAADGTFLVSYTQLYVQSQLALVRRLVDPAKSTGSLAGLLTSIVANPEVMTRDRYCSIHEDDGRFAEATWRRAFADPNDPQRLNVSMVAADLERLTGDLSHLVAWATRTVAHLDRNKPTRVPRFDELREAIATIGQVTNTYGELLARSVTHDWTPVIQGDWEAVFRPALFPIDPRSWNGSDSFS